MEITLHRATNIRIATHDATNANQIALEIESEKGPVEVCIYGLPREITQKLLIGFSDADTVNFTTRKEAAE